MVILVIKEAENSKVCKSRIFRRFARKIFVKQYFMSREKKRDLLRIYDNDKSDFCFIIAESVISNEQFYYNNMDLLEIDYFTLTVN